MSCSYDAYLLENTMPLFDALHHIAYSKLCYHTVNNTLTHISLCGEILGLLLLPELKA